MICLKEVGPVGDQSALRGDEEGESDSMRGDHSYDRHRFFTILDNVLTLGEAARVKNELTPGLALTQETS
jgi:hypothetical protein